MGNERVLERVLIWSDEHRSFWRPGANGYTFFIQDAGVWTREEAERQISGCGPEKMLKLIPVGPRMEQCELEGHGFERVSYNGGAFIGYRKYFIPCEEREEIPGHYMEVRYGERRDIDFVVYMVFPSYMVALPGLRTIEDFEALRVMMARAIR